MTEKEIERVLEEAESMLIECTQILVYAKRNHNDEIVDMFYDSHRNDSAEQNGYAVEWMFRA